jgi:hypothetical protein
MPVTLKITNVFCSDTYLLTASLGIYFILFLYLNEKSSKIKSPLLIYVIFLIYYNFSYTKVFMSDYKLFEYSYTKEATPSVTLTVAHHYTKQGRYNEAEALIQRVKIWQSTNAYLIEAALNNIFYNSQIKNEKKIQRLEGFEPQTALSALYLSILYSNQNQSIGVKNNIQKIVQNPFEYFLYFSWRNENLFAIYTALCEKNNIANCQENLIQLKKDVSITSFDELKFERFLSDYRNNNYYISLNL